MEVKMKIKKIMAVLMMFSLVIVCPTQTFAKDNGNKQNRIKKEFIVTENQDLINQEINETKESWKTEKENLKETRNELKNLRKQVEAEIKNLEKEIKEAEKIGDPIVIENLKEQLEALTVERVNYITEILQTMEEMKQTIREKYTTEELEKLNQASESLEEIEDVAVLPVENIFVKNRDVKFDTPPVIKRGRTLIPVRAIIESMGASVEWNGEEQLVTITKDDKVITFDLKDDKVFIDGVETAIDVSPEVMNNRTMVPLRFIAENFELIVDYDDETEIIEISEDEEINDSEEEIIEAGEETADETDDVQTEETITQDSTEDTGDSI